MNKEMTTKVFVYGSLKRGFHNNPLLKDCKYIGMRFLSNYQMYDVGSFPCIIPTCKHDSKYDVFGELYEVPLDVLCFQLDRLEHYNPYSLMNMYNRVVVETDEGEKCFTYVWNGEVEGLYKEVEDGDWKLV